MENSNNTGEIDLGELMVRIAKILSRYKAVFTALMIIGGLSGFGYYSIKSPVFSSSMMLQSDILTEAYSETLTENLKKLIDESSYTLLAEKLSIDEKQATQLVDIKVESVEGSSGPEGLAKNFIFLISVETKDNSVLVDLQKGIISFLENNEFVKKRIDLKKERFQALIDQMNSEGHELDSLKDLINAKLIDGGGNLVLMDPSNVYEQALNTYKEELVYQENLALIESIQLIEGFTAFNRPVRPRMVFSIATGVLIGLIAALGLIFLRNRENISSLLIISPIDTPNSDFYSKGNTP